MHEKLEAKRKQKQATENDVQTFDKTKPKPKPAPEPEQQTKKKNMRQMLATFQLRDIRTGSQQLLWLVLFFCSWPFKILFMFKRAEANKLKRGKAKVKRENMEKL